MREGLRQVIAAYGEPPVDAPGAAAWRNRLLDETGSDRRGLVQLLLRVRDDGLAAEIPRGPLAPSAWAPIRARLAFDYAASTYLDADMARWAVDAWAYALGAISAEALWSAPPAPGPVVAATSIPPVGQGTRGAPSPPPPAFTGKTTGRVRRAVARANSPVVHNPFPANFDRLAGWAFVAMFVASAGAMWVGIATRREAGGLELPRPRLVTASRNGSERVVARRPPPAPAAVRMPTRDAAEASPATVDTLRLRDGTVRTGRVERITREAIVLRDPWSDALDAIALDDVTELRVGGAALPVGGEVTPTERDAIGRPLPPLPPNAPLDPGDPSDATTARAAGLAGRYSVRQELLGVDGTETCDVVAAAIRHALAHPTVEVVAHQPGDTVFLLETRPGVRGTIDADGRFRTAPIRGVRDGVHYWFRMTGQFGTRGFRAEAESATDAVLKFGSVQRCRVTAALDARRLP